MKNQQFINEDKLSSEQIENWRRILVMEIGPYALIMPPEEIQKHRDKIQLAINIVQKSK